MSTSGFQFVIDIVVYIYGLLAFIIFYFYVIHSFICRFAGEGESEEVVLRNKVRNLSPTRTRTRGQSVVYRTNTQYHVNEKFTDFEDSLQVRFVNYLFYSKAYKHICMTLQ